MSNSVPCLLILGGTSEAVQLAQAAVRQYGERLDVITSLAGRTSKPASIVGKVRTGGFGGSSGLARFLSEGRVGLVVDATHPFAARISAHAREACTRHRVPRLVLMRPPWKRQAGDLWIEVDDLAAAANVLPDVGGRALLTIGRQDLEAFTGIESMWFMVRVMDPPAQELPLANYVYVVARPPFSVASERDLIVQNGIDVLVAKASGGDTTVAKIIAARECQVPVVMVRRPAAVHGMRVETVAHAMTWIEGELRGLDSRSAHGP